MFRDRIKMFFVRFQQQRIESQKIIVHKKVIGSVKWLPDSIFVDAERKYLFLCEIMRNMSKGSKYSRRFTYVHKDNGR